MSDDERPKKSWREIDEMRDRSGGAAGQPRKTPSDRRTERAQKGSAYTQYKNKLDKLFTPGGAALPENLRAKLEPTDELGQKQQALLRALRGEKNEKALRAVVEASLEFPDEPRLLMDLLDVSDDEDLLTPVLQALLGVLESGRKPNRMLLIQKLDALELRLGGGEVVELVAVVRAALD